MTPEEQQLINGLFERMRALGPIDKDRQRLLTALQKAIDGKVVAKGEHFFLKNKQGDLEFTLLAEGMRKLALIWLLIQNGTLLSGSVLFWDEPEANLNPAALRLLAEALFALAGLGVQVIVATHSLFLLREVEVLSRGEPADRPATPVRYFALGLEKKGVSISAGDSIDACDPLVLLDEDLAQSDRFMETLE